MRLTRILITAAVCGIAVLSLSAQSTAPICNCGESPRLAKLTKDIASTGPGTVQAFWAEIARDHAPIIEDVPGDPTRVMLTFLWRDNGAAPAMQVMGHDMRRVAGSDVSYYTITMRRTHRLAYRFFPADQSAPRPDPLNPHRFQPPVEQEYPASAVDHDSANMTSSIVVLPESAVSPYVDVRPGVARGRVEEFSYESRVFGGKRRGWIYHPPQRTPAERAAGVVICLWGRDYLNGIPVPTILDNLIADGKLPPVAAVFVDNDADRFQNFQSTEKFTQSFADELMPWIRAQVPAAVDPERTVIAGYSAAGLESTYIAYAHPELVGRVLAQSGAFWRAFEGTGASEPEWLRGRFLAAPVHSTRFALDVGGEEQQAPVAGGPTFKAAVARLRDALVQKGYAVSFQETPGGEHEFVRWRTLFADELIGLAAGW